MDPLDHPANHHTRLTAFNRYYGWYVGEPDEFAAWADRYHAEHPDKALGISEYGAGASILQHQLPPTKPQHDGPNHPEEWQAVLHEKHWKAMKDRPYLWATFVWNMFDFASDGRNEGDTPGRNDKGLVTYDRKTKKDAFYWYKANWSKSRFVYITSRRYRERTQPQTAIKVYSNCTSVKLRVNDQLIGEGTPSDGVVIWDNVSLSPGENQVEVIGSHEDRTYRDFCTWIYTPQ
jgi:beta-galactosidase